LGNAAFPGGSGGKYGKVCCAKGRAWETVSGEEGGVEGLKEIMAEREKSIGVFLLWIASQMTFRRFLLLWALVGMVVTHSWLSEPDSPPWAHLVALLGTLFFGGTAFYGMFSMVCLQRAGFKLKIPWYVMLPCLYVGVVLVSLLINPSTITLFQILQLVIPIFLCFCYIYVFSSQDISKILTAGTVFGLINLVLVFYLFVLLRNGAESVFPSSGLITDRNGFAKYITIFHVFVLIEFLVQRSTRKRIVLGSVLLFMFLGVLILYSRSGYIVYFLSTALVIGMCESRIIKRLSLIALPIVVLLFAIFTYQRITADRMNVVNASDIGRVYVLKAGINMIKAHPIRGVGYRQSDLKIGQFAKRDLPGLFNIITIHNWYINVWAEMGITGFIIFSLFNLALLVATYKRFRALGFVKGQYALFSFVTLLVTLFDAQVLPNYDYESLYWIVVAVAVISIRTKAGTETVPTAEQPGKRIV
jgi:O-antigen ligase